MKISDLIRKLQILQDKNGDNNLSFSVRDSFSLFSGERMDLNLEVGEDEKGFNWSGSYTVDNYTRIEFNLTGEKGKNSKITYRKR